MNHRKNSNCFVTLFGSLARLVSLALLAVAAIPFARAQTQITIGPTDTTISWTNVGGSGSPAPEGYGFNTARAESHMVDGSGLSMSGGLLVHAKADNDAASNLTQQRGGLLIDLGASYEVGTVQIWGFNYSNFSPTSFDFYYSTDSSGVSLVGGQIQVADLSKFTQLTNDTSLAPASLADGYLGETYTFGAGQKPSYLGDYSDGPQSLSGSAITARYLFLNDLTGIPAAGGRLGFAEIQVYTFAATAVPEPSTYAAIFGALALGSVGVVRRRRATGAGVRA